MSSEKPGPSLALRDPEAPGPSTSGGQGGGACSYVSEPPRQDRGPAQRDWDPQARITGPEWRNLEANISREREQEREQELNELRKFQEPRDVRLLKCVFCNYIKCRKYTKRHMDRVHPNGKPGKEKCTLCGVHTSRKSDLAGHMRREHEAR
jgi:hypothetical protein